MFASWFPTMPVVAPLFVKCGQVTATEDNGIRLLENEELVSVFPEGIKGVGKLYKDRYHLVRFGRGGFIRMALKTQDVDLAGVRSGRGRNVYVHWPSPM